MQVKQENIQRPSLIEPFFNMELSSTNEFIQYIDCSLKSSNVVHKKNNVTSNAYNIKKILKTKKFITTTSIEFGFREIKQVNKFRDIYFTNFHNLQGVKLLIAKSNFISPQSHNNILSLM